MDGFEIEYHSLPFVPVLDLVKPHYGFMNPPPIGIGVASSQLESLCGVHDRRGISSTYTPQILHPPWDPCMKLYEYFPFISELITLLSLILQR